MGIKKLNRFELKESDGETCAQVSVYDEDDLKYWTEQANITGHLLAFDCRIPKNFAGYGDEAHDIYQIFPPEVKDKVFLRDPK